MEFRWYEPNGRLRSKLLGTVEPDAKLLSSRRSRIRARVTEVQATFVAVLYRYAKIKHVSAGFRLENFSMAWQPEALAKKRSTFLL